MNAPSEASKDLPAVGISEAERMAKIRELLVGPVIADESARVDEAVSQINDLLREQQETISQLKVRIGELEERQSVNNKQLRLRLLGVVETLLASEGDVGKRLSENQMLAAKLEDGGRRDGT